MSNVSLYDLHDRAETIPDESSGEHEREGRGHCHSPDAARYLWLMWLMQRMTDEERAEFIRACSP